MPEFSYDAGALIYGPQQQAAEIDRIQADAQHTQLVNRDLQAQFQQSQQQIERMGKANAQIQKALAGADPNDTLPQTLTLAGKAMINSGLPEEGLKWLNAASTATFHMESAVNGAIRAANAAQTNKLRSDKSRWMYMAETAHEIQSQDDVDRWEADYESIVGHPSPYAHSTLINDPDLPQKLEEFGITAYSKAHLAEQAKAEADRNARAGVADLRKKQTLDIANAKLQLDKIKTDIEVAREARLKAVGGKAASVVVDKSTRLMVLSMLKQKYPHGDLSTLNNYAGEAVLTAKGILKANPGVDPAQALEQAINLHAQQYNDALKTYNIEPGHPGGVPTPPPTPAPVARAAARKQGAARTAEDYINRK